MVVHQYTIVIYIRISSEVTITTPKAYYTSMALADIVVILLLYDDDIILMEIYPFDLDNQLITLKDFFSNVGMTINT